MKAGKESFIKKCMRKPVSGSSDTLFLQGWDFLSMHFFTSTVLEASDWLWIFLSLYWLFCTCGYDLKLSMCEWLGLKVL